MRLQMRPTIVCFFSQGKQKTGRQAAFAPHAPQYHGFAFLPAPGHDCAMDAAKASPSPARISPAGTRARNTRNGRHFLARAGRMALCLRVLPLGPDLQAILTGGQAHLGAWAVAEAGRGITCAGERPGHREGPLAARLALMLANGLGCAVCVSAGIHYDAITREEIATVERLAGELGRRAVAALAPAGKGASHPSAEGDSMLTVTELEAFADYIRSGQLETDFTEGCEHDRYALLELLETLMDVADLADEAASRLIYRGILGGGIAGTGHAQGSGRGSAESAAGTDPAPDADAHPGS